MSDSRWIGYGLIDAATASMGAGYIVRRVAAYPEYPGLAGPDQFAAMKIARPKPVRWCSA
jgi:hypothetical protein